MKLHLGPAAGRAWSDDPQSPVDPCSSDEMALVQFHDDWTPDDDEQAFRRVLCADRRVLMVVGRDVELRCRVMSARVDGDYDMAAHNMGHHVCLAAGPLRMRADLEEARINLVAVRAAHRAMLLEPREPLTLGVDMASTRPRGLLGCPRCAGFGAVRTGIADMDGFPVEGPCETCDGSGLAIDWILVRGGEEPLHPAWVRAIRDQCAAAGVPFAFLGWGQWKPIYEPPGQPADVVYIPTGGRLLDGREHLDSPWGPLEVV